MAPFFGDLMRFLLALLCLLPAWCQPLAFGKAGHGPGLVLIHGFAGHRGVFAEWSKPFLDHRTILSVDLPGCGESSPQDPVDFDAIADQVAALMAAQHLERSVLVAHSMGGLVSLRVAVRHPEQVAGLVFLDSPLLPMGKEPAEALALAFEKDPAAAFRGRYASFALNETQLERVVAEAARIPGKVLAGYTRARTVTNGAHVEKVTCPVLLVASPVLIPDASKQAQRLIEAGYAAFAKLQVVRLAQAKHWLMWDDMPASQQAVRTFMATLEK